MCWALIAPLSSIGQFAGAILPITEVHKARADRAMFPTSGAPDWATAERESRAELSIAPFSPAPQLRLALIDAGRHGNQLTEAGWSALRTSYQYDPFDVEIGPWRLTFLIDHWSEAPPDLRRAAQDEVEVLWKFRQTEIREAAAKVRDPRGKLWFLMVIGLLETQGDLSALPRAPLPGR